MKLHELKIKRKYFDDIKRGTKTFEIRKNDRDYKEGDLIHFTIVDEEPPKEFNDCFIRAFKEPYIVFQIVYILKDVPEYGLDKDYCILGIKELIQR